MTSIATPAAMPTRVSSLVAAPTRRHQKLLDAYVLRRPGLTTWAVGPSGGSPTEFTSNAVPDDGSGSVVGRALYELIAYVVETHGATSRIGLRLSSRYAYDRLHDVVSLHTAYGVRRLTSPDPVIVSELDRRHAGSPVVTVASDASVGRAHKVTGLGYAVAIEWLTGPPQVRFGSTPWNGRHTPNEAELQAATSALAYVQSLLKPDSRFGCRSFTVKLLTDSQAAAKQLNDGGSASERLRPLVRSSGGPEVQWVKGHAGHPLNEAADRLAVLARRDRVARVDAAEHAAKRTRIEEELRPMIAEWASAEGKEMR